MHLAATFLIITLAQAGAPLPPLAHPDFPRADRPIWDMQRRGLTAKIAAQTVRSGASDLPALERLVAADKIADALRVLRRIVERQPAAMADAFQLMSQARGWALRDRSRDHHLVLQQIVELAYERLIALPREEAARAERQLIMVDTREVPNQSFTDRLAQFVDKYRGTVAATFAEIEVIQARMHRLGPAPMDEFLTRHPDGVFAANALYEKARYLGSSFRPVVAGYDPDPNVRLPQVAAIVAQLQSGRYPDGEWVSRSRTLVSREFWTTKTLSAANLAIVIDNLARSLEARDGVTFWDFDPAESLLTYQLPPLLERSGEGARGIERIIADFERRTGDRATAEYFRWLVLSHQRREAPQNAGLAQRAAAALDGLVRGSNQYSRWALVTLARFYFDEDDFASARLYYQQFLDRFPSSAHAWVAALRIGECAEATGDLPAAAAAYRTAAAIYRDNPLAVVFGHMAAARVFQAQEDLNQTMAEYRRALAAWDPDYGDEYTLDIRRPARGDRSGTLDGQFSITRAKLAERVRRTRQAVASPAGRLLERGRWLLEQNRFQDARGTFEQLLSSYPRSAHVAEARRGAYVARLRHGLTLEAQPGQESAVIGELEALSRAAEIDSVGWIVDLARATILWKQTATADAEALMKAALAKRHAWPRRRARCDRRTALDKDVHAIRTLLLTPPRPTTPYRLVHAEVNIALADGTLTVVEDDCPIAGLGTAVFLTAEELALLEAIARSIAPYRDNTSGSELNRLLRWWNGFFEAGPLVWGSMHLQAHPFVYRVEFLGSQRTRAAVRLAISDSEGETAVVEKIGGTWRLVRRTDRWIA